MNSHSDQTDPLQQKSLLEDLRAMLASVPGAPERERLLSLLPTARTFEISDEMTTAVSDTLSQRPHTVEHNLDFLMLPEGVCWFEWDERARRTDVDILMDEIEHPDRLGALIAYANDDTKAVVGTVAWRFRDGRVDHAPAFFSWDEDHLWHLAKRARFSYSKVPRESWARMMSMIYTHVPEGYIDEMDVLGDLREQGPDIDTMASSARREVSAEALFLLGVLLMLQTGRASAERQGDREILKMVPQRSRLLPTLRPKGFCRKTSRRGTRLDWNRVPPSL